MSLIIDQPVDIVTKLGAYVSLSALVQAPSWPSFQWYNKFGKPMPNENKNNLSIGPIKQEDFGFYKLEILDLNTNQKIHTRWVEIREENVYPILQGESFTLTAHFNYATNYQWYRDGVELRGMKGNSLYFSNVTKANSGVYVLGANNDYSGILVLTDPVKIQVL